MTNWPSYKQRRNVLHNSEVLPLRPGNHGPLNTKENKEENEIISVIICCHTSGKVQVNYIIALNLLYNPASSYFAILSIWTSLDKRKLLCLFYWIITTYYNLWPDDIQYPNNVSLKPWKTFFSILICIRMFPCFIIYLNCWHSYNLICFL